MEIRKQIMTRSRDTAPESGSSSPLLRGGGGGAGGGQYNAVSLVLFFLWFLFMFLKLCLRVYLLKITFSCSTVESEGSMLWELPWMPGLIISTLAQDHQCLWKEIFLHSDKSQRRLLRDQDNQDIGAGRSQHKGESSPNKSYTTSPSIKWSLYSLFTDKMTPSQTLGQTVNQEGTSTRS